MKEILASLFLSLSILFGGVSVIPEAKGSVIEYNYPREAERYRRTLIREARAVWGLEAPISLFAAQIHQESLWKFDAKSWVGAEGLSQFMPSTASWIVTVFPELDVPNTLNPRWSIRAMVRYNRWLRDRVTGSTPCEQAGFWLASYNGGLGWTRKRKALSPEPEVCFGATCDINPGISNANQKQNSEYSRKIRAKERDYLMSRQWGEHGACWSQS